MIKISIMINNLCFHRKNSCSNVMLMFINELVNLVFRRKKYGYWNERVGERAGGRLPKGYPFCPGSSSYSFKIGSICLADKSYIGDVHITRIFFVDSLSEKYQLLDFYFLHTIAYKGTLFVRITSSTVFKIRSFLFCIPVVYI